MRISNSKANTFQRCQKKFEFKYVQGWRPRKKAIQLERGDWLHQMLMAHYDGEGWKPRWEELKDAFYELWEEEREEYGDLPGETKRIMQSYLRYWRAEDTRIHVIDSEVDELIPLPNGDMFNFIIDLIVEEDGGLWLWDHKTVKSFMNEDFKLLDAQLARYFWAAQKMGYTPLHGVMFNELRTKPPTIPPVLKSGRITQRQKLDTDVFTYMRAIKRAGHSPEDYRDTLLRLARQSDRWFRRTRLPKDRPLTKRLMRELLGTSEDINRVSERGLFTRTRLKSCTWDCDYTDACVVELFGGDPMPILKNKFTRRKRDDTD